MPFFGSALLHIGTQWGAARYMLASEKLHCISWLRFKCLAQGHLM